mmetsp:Transcript_8571/g.17826  ORF Transcript_8571/g.17826 Transcript_8571/m.17826 type:complete len:99 (-) Transcript_8571:316-612(-)
MMSSFIPNEKNENSSMITKSNSFENSTWGTITDFTEPSLPVLVNMPTSDAIKLNDQVSKFLTLMIDESSWNAQGIIRTCANGTKSQPLDGKFSFDSWP